MHTTTNPLAYYERHGAALFPIPVGSKAPTGIVANFTTDHSRDPVQWAAWRTAHPGCNFGLVAGPSALITIDIDVIKAGCEAAWAAWCDLCAAWGVTVFAPHVQSARGGWHVYFAVPADIDPATLRQPDAVRDLINVRAGNGYVVAAGSMYADRAYTLLSDAPPYPAPAALIAHCTRRTRGTSAAVGNYEPADVAKLVSWLAERDTFVPYEDWVQIGMALKIECGDAGFDIWELTHDDTVTPEVAAAKWESFSTEPGPGAITLNSFMARAHKAGWNGKLNTHGGAATIFKDAVAQLAANAGAQLASGMAGWELTIDELTEPLLREFLTVTRDAPTRPSAADFPTLPETLSDRPFYNAMRDCIARIVAMGETPKKFNARRALDVFGALYLIHEETYGKLLARLRGLGCRLPEKEINAAGLRLQDQAQRICSPITTWQADQKSNRIEADNPDNVQILLNVVQAEVRWNAWLERPEIRGHIWPDWVQFNDVILQELLTRAKRTKTRFCPAKEFLLDTLTTFARAIPVDPVIDALAELEAAWDGTPRLVVWLSICCGVPCDPYHQVVGKNIIGGMVRRIRNPGCKHDEMAVLFGRQGTGKSTLARILALDDAWFTDSIKLGTEARELQLLLAGKSVVEFSEMSKRTAADIDHIKSMISSVSDYGRAVWERLPKDRRRRNIFIGTANARQPLTDDENRRFLPVKCDTPINLEWLRENIGQLIGEAAALERAGATFGIPDELRKVAADYQNAARSVSSTEIMFESWFGETEFTQSAFVLAADLTELCHRSSIKALSTSAYSGVMHALGFRNESIRWNGQKTRVWVRSEPMLPRHITERCIRYALDPRGGASVVVTQPRAGSVEGMPAEPL